MDRRPFDRLPPQNQTAPPPSSHASPFPPPQTAQPPAITPFADPFQTNRDPFFPGGNRRGSLGLGSRAWQPTQGSGNTSHSGQQPPPPTHHHHHLQQQQQHLHQHSPPQQPVSHPQGLPPPPAMPHPFDDPRRRSLGTAASPPLFARSSFPARNMPPPSPTSNTSSSSAHHNSSAMRQPPTTTSSYRPSMSISAMLGGGEERRPIGSPHSSAAAPAPMPRSMQPPSPGRARASSMREGNDRDRGMKGYSPPHGQGGMFREPARMASEPRRDGVFGSPSYRREPPHSFRPFQPGPHEHLERMNGHGHAPPRPNSQPVETAGPRRHLEDMMRPDDRSGIVMRHYGEPPGPPRSDVVHPFQQNGITSHPQDRHPQDRSVYNSPRMEQPPPPQQGPPMRYVNAPGNPNQPGQFGPPMREGMREEQASLFRPAYQPTSHPAPDQPRESIEGRAPDRRRQISRPSPPPEEYGPHPRDRYADRPMTFEEHQRMEMMHREQQYKDGESAVHRGVLNLSPELHRRGRNSPLPQAVQGAQPRHVGPGGDNPGIKMEFGRMFSGLGSGVGSATPVQASHPNHPGNGTHTPSRSSPARQPGEDVDDLRNSAKAGSRGGKKNGRRSREEMDPDNTSGRNTPATKRAKATHPHHHHHHHHVTHHHHHRPHNEQPEVTPTSNAVLSAANLAAHHHHHHHHAHPIVHHHHHATNQTPKFPPPPPLRKPSFTVSNQKVLDMVAGKERKHLGSQLYSTEILPAGCDATIDSKFLYRSRMKPLLPLFDEEKVGCEFMVRVPRQFLRGEGLEVVCRGGGGGEKIQVWGTEVYTDDSDIVGAMVHDGWVQGEFGDEGPDLTELVDSNDGEAVEAEVGMLLKERPKRPVRIPAGVDAHVTILILPPLEAYSASHRNHVRSRAFGDGRGAGGKLQHDGMSFMINKIEFVDEGIGSRFLERGSKGRKVRLRNEEAARREAAMGLMMFAGGAAAAHSGNGNGVEIQGRRVGVGA